MIDNFDFAGEYHKWIKNNTIVDVLSTGWTEIITPFLDINNDFITIYLKKNRNMITISDDSYTINNLSLSLKSRKVKTMLEKILSNYGVYYKNMELIIESNINDFSFKIQMFIEAIISINSIFSLNYENNFDSKSNSRDIFLEKVFEFFISNKLTYRHNINIIGKSGFEYKIDLWIPESKQKNKPAKLVKAFNTLREDAIGKAIFTLDDIKSTINSDIQLTVFLNDDKKFINDKFNVAIKNYNGILIPWTERNNFIDELSTA